MEAERPLLIASSLGRVAEEAIALARMAERFALPVVAHTPRYLCLPTDHPLHHGFDPHPFLDDADLILVIEADVPWMPSVKAPHADRARRSHRRGPGVPALSHALVPEPSVDSRQRRRRACARWRPHWKVARERSRRDSSSGGDGRARAAAQRAKVDARVAADAPHISPEYLSRCIGEIAGADGLIFNEYQLRLDACARTRPGSYFALSPAGGLGWSVGAALGAKLAAPDRFVVATIGDGGMIFANPTACHWVAEAHELPILMVIFNNERYGAVRNATMAMFASGAAGRENGLGLADLSPSPPFERYAEAHGAFAARVERPADLPAVLAAAREAVVNEKRHALVNVMTPY